MTTPNDVACFGELLWDFFETDDKGERDPVARTFRRELGGASANVAVVLARLGLQSAAVGGVGDDKLGASLAGALESEGVDVAGVAKVSGRRTGLTFVSRDAFGVPTFAPYRTGTADLVLPEKSVASGAGKAKFGVVGSTAMLGPTRPATEKFLAALGKAKGALVVDLNARAHLWPDAAPMREACAELASRAAIVKASERDLSAVAGKRGISWLEEHAKDAVWVLTRGENGAAAVGKHGQVTAKTKRVRCIDATGAGDAFVAGVMAVLVRAGAKPGSAAFGDPKVWTRALEMGHALGAKAVSAVGAVSGLTRLEDIRARLGSGKKG